jgi:hypothetical protein
MTTSPGLVQLGSGVRSKGAVEGRSAYAQMAGDGGDGFAAGLAGAGDGEGVVVDGGWPAGLTPDQTAPARPPGCCGR